MSQQQQNFGSLLLIDPDENARDSLELLLAGRFDVDSVDGCDAALVEVRRRQDQGLPPYDALLIDLDLGRHCADGYETLHWLRGCEGYSELAVPAIAFSRHLCEVTVLRCIDAGFELLLPKHGDPDVLCAEVELLLGVEGLERPQPIRIAA